MDTDKNKAKLDSQESSKGSDSGPSGRSHSKASCRSHSKAPCSCHSKAPCSCHSKAPCSCHSKAPCSCHSKAPCSCHSEAPCSCHSEALCCCHSEAPCCCHSSCSCSTDSWSSTKGLCSCISEESCSSATGISTKGLSSSLPKEPYSSHLEGTGSSLSKQSGSSVSGASWNTTLGLCSSASTGSCVNPKQSSTSVNEPYYSARLQNIIQEIIDDSKPKPKIKPKPKNFIAENVKNLRQVDATQKREKEILAHQQKGYLARMQSKQATCHKTVPSPSSCASSHSDSCEASQGEDKGKKQLDLPHPLGYLPPYVKKWNAIMRKVELAEDKANKVNVPAGHSLLPDHERLKTLNSLKECHSELVKELNSFPFSSGSLSMRERKADVERKLAKTEEGIQIFSRPYVFVRDDSED